MQTEPTRDQLIGLAKEYFDRVDGRKRERVDALFAEDCEFYFPKFGVGQGKGALRDIGLGLAETVKEFQHDVSSLRYAVDGHTVIVEGTTHGTMRDGGSWRGGESVGGRFCSVFEFRDSLISRMYIYVDPDYSNADASRYPSWLLR